jgi:deazaflavin-dependent oxidoreductase (nitroreductase family)
MAKIVYLPATVSVPPVRAFCIPSRRADAENLRSVQSHDRQSGHATVCRPTAPFAIVTHRGRVSGRVYATPVWAFGTHDGLVIALLYGARSDWAQNVLAAGHAQVKRSGTAREYTQPQLLGDAGIRLIPAIARVPVRFLRTHDLLCLTGPRPN